MNKFYVLVLMIFYHLLPSQKLENFYQSIETTNGHFNISTVSENYYNESLKNKLELVSPKKNNNEIDFNDLKLIFPELIVDKCIIIDDKDIYEKKMKICDESLNDKLKSEDFTIYGFLSIDSFLDEF